MAGAILEGHLRTQKKHVYSMFFRYRFFTFFGNPGNTHKSKKSFLFGHFWERFGSLRDTFGRLSCYVVPQRGADGFSFVSIACNSALVAPTEVLHFVFDTVRTCFTFGLVYSDSTGVVGLNRHSLAPTPLAGYIHLPWPCMARYLT